MPFLLLGPEGRKQLKTLGSVGTVGLDLAASIVVGFFGGKWLDQQLGTDPWLRWLGLFIGLAAGFRALYRVARQTQKQLSQKQLSDNEPRADS